MTRLVAQIIRVLHYYLATFMRCLALFSYQWIAISGRGKLYRVYEVLSGHPVSFRLPGFSLPSVRPESILCMKSEVCLQELASTDGNVSIQELAILCAFAKERKPKTTLEIGTFDGRTTLNLAANCPEDTTIFTLDLPQADRDLVKLPLEPNDLRFIEKSTSGTRFKGKPQEMKIIQLLGDSASLDFRKHCGAPDFIFIDGSHSFEYVLSDSRRAVELLPPTGGCIIWPDYG